MNKLNYNQNGRSVLEIIVIVAIMGVVVAAVIPGLSNFRNRQLINNTTTELIAILSDARGKTLSGYNDTNYSVRFESTRAVFFTGGTFTEPNASNVVSTLDTRITLPTISLNGGGNNVTFTRLTGETTNYGTIVVRLVADSNIQKTITISKTGIVSSD